MNYKGYEDAFMEALANEKLVSEYDRLRGTSLGECLKSLVKGGINYEIDLASGRIKEEIQKFDRFFHDYIWSTIPDESSKK